MQIANPIYDTIFKYLMDNVEIAKDILSAILNKEIVTIETKPEETKTETADGVRIFRLDFKATIRDKDGSLEMVLIEIQKSKKGFEIQRFRRYLGSNYMMEEELGNTQVSLPITTIYFLGFRLKNIKIPFFKAERTYSNAVTQKKILNPIKEDFVEQLSHDMYVIQIPRLKKMIAQTQLEKILDVFSQAKYQTNDKHVLEYTGDMTDPRVERIVKYLSRAMSTEEIRRKMDAEDEVERVINRLENTIEEINAKIEKANAKAAEASAKAAEASAKAAEASAKAAESKIKEQEAKIEAEEARVLAEQERLAKEQTLLENELLKKQLEALMNKPKDADDGH